MFDSLLIFQLQVGYLHTSCGLSFHVVDASLRFPYAIRRAGYEANGKWMSGESNCPMGQLPFQAKTLRSIDLVAYLPDGPVFPASAAGDDEPGIDI
jgi:hypothetical protein